MKAIKAHYDGHVVVPEEPMNLPVNTAVQCWFQRLMIPHKSLERSPNSQKPRSAASGTTTKMPPTTSYKPGDVVLAPFPFSDQTSIKQRPALVISVEDFQERGPDRWPGIAITSPGRRKIGSL